MACCGSILPLSRDSACGPAPRVTGAIRHGAIGPIGPASRPTLGYDARVRRPAMGGACPRTATSCTSGSVLVTGRARRGTRCRASRSRTWSGPLLVGLIVLVVVAVAALFLRRRSTLRIWDASSPPGDPDIPGPARSTSPVRHRVRLRGRDLRARRRADLWTVIRYRRKPGETTCRPRRTATTCVEVIWTVDPDGHRARSCSCSRGRRSTRRRRRVPAERPDPGRRARSSSGRSSTSTPNGEQALFTQIVPPEPTGAWSCRSASRSTSASRAGRHPRLLRAPVPVQAGRHPGPGERLRLHGRPEYAGQTFRGQCAELCGTVPRTPCSSTCTPMTPPDYDAWLSRRPQASPSAHATSPAPPRAHRSSGGQAATTVELAAKNIAFDQTPA